MSSYQEYHNIFDREIIQASKGILYSFSPLNDKHTYQPYCHRISDDAVEQLGKLMRHNLLFYSYGEDEVVEYYNNHSFSSLEQAAKYAYMNRLPHRDATQDGLPSEVLLDLLVQIYNPTAYKLAVRTIFRQNDNFEIKGYDLTYFTKDKSAISLWLGQAKLGEKSYCKNGIKNDLLEKYIADYIAKQLYFICDKRIVISEEAKSILSIIEQLNIRTIADNDADRAKQLIDFLNKHNILIKIPCLLAYDQKSVYNNASTLYNKITSEVEELKDFFNSQSFIFSGFNPEILFYVFPIESINCLRDKGKGFYAGLC